MDDLLKKLEAEKELRFKKTWTKLEKGNKLNRLNLYIEHETKEKELSEDTSKKLKKLLHTIFEKGILSKSSEIEYCNETCKIISIKNLVYDEDKNEYNFNLPKKVIKPTTKSKSKIDRHFSRSKENK
tara:strand:- start:684 stop:1064 length:381 start_codon:yes stop_codon:yes gene_type:complete